MDEPGAYLRRLPIGQRLPLGETIHDPLFPFDGQISVQPLQEPILPEPERPGVVERDCRSCNGSSGDDFVAWEDERWRLLIDPQPTVCPWWRCCSRRRTTTWRTYLPGRPRNLGR